MDWYEYKSGSRRTLNGIRCVTRSVSNPLLMVVDVRFTMDLEFIYVFHKHLMVGKRGSVWLWSRQNVRL